MEWDKRRLRRVDISGGLSGWCWPRIASTKEWPLARAAVDRTLLHIQFDTHLRILLTRGCVCMYEGKGSRTRPDCPLAPSAHAGQSSHSLAVRPRPSQPSLCECRRSNDPHFPFSPALYTRIALNRRPYQSSKLPISNLVKQFESFSEII